ADISLRNRHVRFTPKSGHYLRPRIVSIAPTGSRNVDRFSGGISAANVITVLSWLSESAIISFANQNPVVGAHCCRYGPRSIHCFTSEKLLTDPSLSHWRA